MVKSYLMAVAKFFGLSGSQSSILGKHAREVISQQWTRQTASVTLVALASATFFIHTLGNIGGPMAVNGQGFSSPTVTADLVTSVSIQKPIEFTSESRGVSWFHAGADLVAPVGTSVRPIMEGSVTSVDNNAWGGGYGKHIIVSHAQGYESLYAHLSKIEVEAGQTVSLEREIAKSGNTGLSTGPHLHLEIHQNGKVINPAELVPGVK